MLSCLVLSCLVVLFLGCVVSSSGRAGDRGLPVQPVRSAGAGHLGRDLLLRGQAVRSHVSDHGQGGGWTGSGLGYGLELTMVRDRRRERRQSFVPCFSQQDERCGVRRSEGVGVVAPEQANATYLHDRMGVGRISGDQANRIMPFGRVRPYTWPLCRRVTQRGG